MKMDVELPHESEELIKFLADRIEEIERTLADDEDFCNKDIDATYQAALNYFQSFQRKFDEKLNELKAKLEKIREENFKTSKQNQKQFDDEIEEINQLFSSGKHQEAVKQFHDYEKCFQQRTTIIQTIPKLYMNDIDINRYFSIDKPIVTPRISLNINKQNSSDNIKPEKIDFIKKGNDEANEHESFQPCYDVRFKHSDNQTNNNHSVNKESKSPLSSPSPRSLHFSTRLPPSSSTKSLPIPEHDIDTPPLLAQSNTRNSLDDNNNHVQVRSTPSSPHIIPSIIQRQMSTIKTNKGDGLSPTYVANYQYERNTFLLMTCDKNHIILFRSQSDRLTRWCSIIIDRSNPIERDSKLHNLFIKSIGFIDKDNIYIFTEREFLIYSSDFLSKYYSCILLNDHNYNSEYNNVHLGFGGIVHEKYIYHIYLSIKDRWILSILERPTIKHLCDHDLTEIFPDVKRFIHISIHDRTISFLVEMDGRQYAVMFCSNTIHSKMEFKRLIYLSYAENPLTICPVYIPYIQKYLFFINDPSAKIIHILTNERYLQSYSIMAYTLCYVEENQELIFTSPDGIYAIHINEQQKFFSKFH